MSVSNILSITAVERLDSRGNPTVQTIVNTSHGRFTALVPSGASKGDYEAVELRDADPSRYHGNGVLQAVQNIRTVLGPKLIEQKFDVASQQRAVDDFLCKIDGSKDKSRLGANAILGISMAVARAGAAARGVPLYEHLAHIAGRRSAYILPVPFFNVLNGGVHSGNPMAFQEMMIAPIFANSIAQAIQQGSEVYHALKSLIISKFGRSAIGIGDEGGFAPPISEPQDALNLLIDAIKHAGYEGKIKIGIDPASQEFYNNGSGQYDLGMKWDQPNFLSRTEMRLLYQDLLARYPIVLLEDPFGQDDWETWVEFQKTCPIELVGDDLLATNMERINEAAEKKACNGLLLKINQIGTITESIDAANRAYDCGWSVFVSHRSGETTDDFIADLTVALGTGHLKSGSPCRGERVAKYNRLMDIEDELHDKQLPSRFAGASFRTAHQE